MKAVSIHDAKTNLSKYMAAAKQGQRIYFGPRGEPDFELVYRKPTEKKTYRKLGTYKGKIEISPDAFSDEVDQEIAKSIYGDSE
jgi:antitoxin (DNA-binding transcriptional repressor) of toxin-antitoxin stability system